MKTAVKLLKPHPLNAEIYQLSGIEDLAESIEQVGLLEPLVVNTENQVISGHRRLRAIKQLKWKSVEVIVRKDIPQDNEAGQVSKMLSNGIGDGSLCCSGGPGFDTVAWVNVLPELVDGLSDRWSHGHAPPVL